MTNKDWVKSKLEGMDIKSLTPEQIQKYNLELQAYAIRREEMKQKRSKLLQKISQLEKELQATLPATSTGVYIHSGTAGCGLKAVFQVGKDKDEKPVFYCLFCKKDYQLTKDSPDKIDTKDPLVYE